MLRSFAEKRSLNIAGGNNNERIGKKALEAKWARDLALANKAGEVGEAIIETAVHGYEAVEEGAVKGYKAIEKGVVGGYKKVEETVVGAYKKVEDAFVGKFLVHEGETVEDAKKRLAEEQAAREQASRNASNH